MAKLTLTPEPRFKATVQIPVAGGESSPLVVTFKHRTKTELNKFVAERGDKSDTESFMEMVEGWDLSDEFNAANVDLLLESYIGAALATYQAYIEELVRHKAKN